jgi:hypothetical protein
MCIWISCINLGDGMSSFCLCDTRGLGDFSMSQLLLSSDAAYAIFWWGLTAIIWLGAICIAILLAINIVYNVCKFIEKKYKKTE